MARRRQDCAPKLQLLQPQWLLFGFLDSFQTVLSNMLVQQATHSLVALCCQPCGAWHILGLEGRSASGADCCCLEDRELRWAFNSDLIITGFPATVSQFRSCMDARIRHRGCPTAHLFNACSIQASAAALKPIVREKVMRLVPIPEVMYEFVNISKLHGALLLLPQSWPTALALQVRKASMGWGLVVRVQVAGRQLLG